MRNIKYIIIHHSATPKDLELDKQIQSFNNSHKNRLHPKENWYKLHIAYHYVVWHCQDKDNLYQKTRPLNEIGYHASNWKINQESIGICVCGNFDKEEPYWEQYDMVFNIIQWLKWLRSKKLNISKNVKIVWHNEFSKKTCPWNNFIMWQLKPVRIQWKWYDVLEKVNSIIWNKINNPKIKKMLHETNEMIRWNIR